MRNSNVTIAALAAILFSLFGTLNAFAAPALGITQTGSRSWTVMGSGLDAIGGIRLTIRYDSTLINPTVTNGSVVAGTMAMANTATPGVINFGAVSANPFSKNAGDILKIDFQSGQGKVQIESKDLATASNNPQIVKDIKDISDSGTGAETGAGTTGTGTTGTGTTGTGTTGTGTTGTGTTGTGTTGTGTTGTGTTGQAVVIGGSVTMPTDNMASKETKEQPKQPDAVAEPLRSESTASDTVTAQSEPERQTTGQKAEKQEKYVSYTSALERFRDFKGKRTPEELLALFTLPQKGYRQEPSVFLADGKGTLKVLIPLNASATASPNFAINKEAQMASLPKVEVDSWVIVLKPKKGVYQVVLSYFLDEVSTDIPLAVAPALEAYNGKPFNKMDESDLIKFLDRPESLKTDLSKDLNGDKKVDYVDDYIFAANYLVQAPKVTPPAQPKKDTGPAQQPKPAESPVKPSGKLR